MRTLINGFARRHAFNINWYSSLLGTMGLGYLLFQRFTFAIPLSMWLIFMMACTKLYLFHLVDGRPIVPRDKSVPYMIAWWICFGSLLAFFSICAIALLVAIFGIAFTQ